MAEDNINPDEKRSSGSISLESILAEYKGSAFINGEKRMPPELLQEKADRILQEAAAMTVGAKLHSTLDVPNFNDSPKIDDSPDFDESPDIDEMPIIITPYSESPAADQASPVEQAVPEEKPNKLFDDEIAGIDSTIVLPTRNVNIELQTGLQTEEQPETYNISSQNTEPGEGREDNSVLFFDQYRNQIAHTSDEDTIVQDVEKAVERELGHIDDPERASRRDFGRDVGNTVFDQEIPADGDDYGYDDEENFYSEPSLRDAAGRFARSCNSISLRCIPASVVTVFMVILTFVYEAGLLVPFGIGYDLALVAGTLVFCQLIVMMLCADVIVRGVDFLVRGAPNAETLILFSCVFSLISAVFTILSGAAEMLPFCAVSALSLTFAAYGEKYSLRAITETLKTAAGSSEPFGVQAEFNTELDKSVLKKTFNRTDGFYNNLMQPDITEMMYRFAAPVLLVATLVLSVFIVLIRGGAENSLHILSALLAAAAPFSALLSFSIPFGTVAKAIRKSGASVAGWGGADDICYTDGVCVTDDDLFPPGMLKLSGSKEYNGASPEKAMRYTASLIIASGSGLTNLFTEVLQQHRLGVINVKDFECHESGIGALIHGEHVATGSAAFMNLLGVRVPDDTNMKNAVYTAVNNSLVAMYAIDYKPLPSVQSALISMLKWRIDLFFAMRDFNVTPAMVGQKFKVPFESFVFIPAKDSYSISDLYSSKLSRMAAVLIREGLSPFAEAITGARLLRSASMFATVLSVVSAALGVIIMFLMCWSGSFISASPGNLVVFMLCMLVTVLVICGYVRLKK